MSYHSWVAAARSFRSCSRLVEEATAAERLTGFPSGGGSGWGLTTNQVPSGTKDEQRATATFGLLPSDCCLLFQGRTGRKDSRLTIEVLPATFCLLLTAFCLPTVRGGRTGGFTPHGGGARPHL